MSTFLYGAPTTLKWSNGWWEPSAGPAAPKELAISEPPSTRSFFLNSGRPERISTRNTLRPAVRFHLPKPLNLQQRLIPRKREMQKQDKRFAQRVKVDLP